MSKQPTAAQKRRMDRVSRLPCLACGRLGVEIHHSRANCGMGQRRHGEIIPLCSECHRTGPESRHGNPRVFAAKHGHDGFLHTCTQKLLGEL